MKKFIEKIKEFGKKVVETAKTIVQKIVEFFKNHGESILIDSVSIGLDVMIFGTMFLIAKNDILKYVFGFNFGIAGFIVAFLGCTGLAIVMNGMIENYIRNDMADLFESIDVIKDAMDGGVVDV